MTQFCYDKVKDPLFFKENVLPAHSIQKIYRNKEELLRGESSLEKSLDGIWKFSYAVNIDSAIAEV